MVSGSPRCVARSIRATTKPSITRRVATLWPLYPTALRSRAWATIGFSRETGDGWKAICSSVLSINDIFDIELDIRDPDEMVRTVRALEPAFRGINLEDTEPPDCFYIEESLCRQMWIRVFHDDQNLRSRNRRPLGLLDIAFAPSNR